MKVNNTRVTSAIIKDYRRARHTAILVRRASLAILVY